MRCLALDGREAVASVALAARRAVEVELEENNIWGIRVSQVTSDYHARPAGGHRDSAIGASARIEDATERFEEALESLLKVAPLDRKMRRLAEEIRKTTRRVNALEQRLLPALQSEVELHPGGARPAGAGGHLPPETPEEEARGVRGGKCCFPS